MNRLVKTVLVYFCISIFTMFFTYIYSLFSHGMSSASMTYLYLLPFILGCGLYLIIYLVNESIAERSYFRLFYNIYNTAVAILTAGQLLNGIFVIAGSGSKLLRYYYITAGILFAVSFIILARVIREQRNAPDN